jgi:hypothetical protein
MRRALKTLLLWLLISLFPLQGMAGAMSPCGNAAAASAAAVSNKHAALDQIDHHAAPAHCPSHDADDSAGAAAAHHATCSACAACCIGASAPPSNQPPAASHAMSESDFAALDLLGGDFIPAGLERPPKFS